jgi:hypothetical protein
VPILKKTNKDTTSPVFPSTREKRNGYPTYHVFGDTKKITKIGQTFRRA